MWDNLERMPHHSPKNAALSRFFRLGLLKFLGVLTFGIFGGVGDFWNPQASSGRREFWQNYVLVPALLAVVGFAAFRILNVHGYLSPLHYGARKMVLCAILSPAIFAHAVGQIRRLRDIGVPPWAALLNFVPFWGTLSLLIFCGAFPRMGRARSARPKGF